MRNKKIAGFILVLLLLPLSFPPPILGEREDLPDYWRRPVPLQAQKGFSLNPEGCSQCHRDQHEDWKRSLHSKAVGPGLLSQLRPYDDPGFTASCYFCHAPMTEQSEIAGVEEDKEDRGFVKNPGFDMGLKLSGVSCSACHLRDGEVYGPPPGRDREGRSEVRGEKSEAGNMKKETGRERQQGHSEFIVKDFFERAEFCASCHQLDEGYELNGKPLTNTYREWKESIYGENKISCQSCHMPGRRHLFRGIHDTEMVKKGITFDVAYTGQKASLLMTNSGVGHFFPTYVTPLVVVKGYLVEGDGKMILSSVKEAYIGRRVTLDLAEEEYDTRLAPGKTFEFDYILSSQYDGANLVFEVWVYPDEFYNRFYRAMLDEGVDDSGRMEMEKALKTTEGSHYRLFKKVLLLHD